jgi:acetyl-CoA carboxylase carboxyltransferase component
MVSGKFLKHNNMKQTAVEWLISEIKSQLIARVTELDLYSLQQQAKEMEKQQSQKYAEFAIHCDRNNLPILTFEDFIKL